MCSCVVIRLTWRPSGRIFFYFFHFPSPFPSCEHVLPTRSSSSTVFFYSPWWCTAFFVRPTFRRSMAGDRLECNDSKWPQNQMPQITESPWRNAAGIPLIRSRGGEKCVSYLQRLSTREATADDANNRKRGHQVQTAKGRWPRTQVQ